MARRRQILLIGFGSQTLEEDLLTLKNSIGEHSIVLKTEKNGIRYILLHFNSPKRFILRKKKIANLNYSSMELKTRDIFQYCNIINFN
jgi:hypothetical protein